MPEKTSSSRTRKKTSRSAFSNFEWDEVDNEEQAAFEISNSNVSKKKKSRKKAAKPTLAESRTKTAAFNNSIYLSAKKKSVVPPVSSMSFDDVDDENDLTLPSYGRTALKTLEENKSETEGKTSFSAQNETLSSSAVSSSAEPVARPKGRGQERSDKKRPSKNNRPKEGQKNELENNVENSPKNPQKSNEKRDEKNSGAQNGVPVSKNKISQQSGNKNSAEKNSKKADVDRITKNSVSEKEAESKNGKKPSEKIALERKKAENVSGNNSAQKKSAQNNSADRNLTGKAVPSNEKLKNRSRSVSDKEKEQPEKLATSKKVSDLPGDQNIQPERNVKPEETVKSKKTADSVENAVKTEKTSRIEKTFENEKTSGKRKDQDGFRKMKLSQEMLTSLKKAGYETPTPIQEGTIPEILRGSDLMGQARTGTGKTAAFMVPILDNVCECEPGDDPVALVLVPTRELAVQVRDESEKLAWGQDINIVACYGGKPIAGQIEKFKDGVDVVVGTPGRILDMMNRRAIRFQHLRWVVLDEADRMLDIGFRPDIEKILRATPASRQTLLFSATLSEPVEHLAQRYMKEPLKFDFSASDISSETIEQFYITVDQERKFDALVRLIEQEKPAQAIVFCRTKRRVEKISRLLGAVVKNVVALHGDLTQTVRDRVMKSFREKRAQILVATDVVGRGIDISGISHIINYDIPQFCDDYVHRVGRTGRMGHEGVAFTLVTSEEGSELTRIEMRINRLLKRADLPGFEAFSKPVDKGDNSDADSSEAKPVYGKTARRIRRAL